MKVGDVVLFRTISILAIGTAEEGKENKVGIIVSKDILSGTLGYFGFNVEWSDGTTSIETAFRIKKCFK